MVKPTNTYTIPSFFVRGVVGNQGKRGTPGSMNSLLSDFFQGILEGDLRGRSGVFRGDFGRFLVEK